MSPSAHSRGAHSGTRKRTSWLPSRGRSLAPPARHADAPDLAGPHDHPGPAASPNGVPAPSGEPHPGGGPDFSAAAPPQPHPGGGPDFSAAAPPQATHAPQATQAGAAILNGSAETVAASLPETAGLPGWLEPSGWPEESGFSPPPPDAAGPGTGAGPDRTGENSTGEPDTVDLPVIREPPPASPPKTPASPPKTPASPPKTAAKPPAPPQRRGAGLVSRAHLPRLIAFGVVAALVAAGLLAGPTPNTSPESLVQQFLLDWEQGQYLAAARLTTGDPASVAHVLQTSFQQLDAASLTLSMGRIRQHGDNGAADFQASVDLGQDGAPWTYAGRFGLRWTAPTGWRVQWSLSVINPALRPGTRLAVRTTLSSRGLVLDSSGQPLQQPSPTYVLGVQPDLLTDPQQTADLFADVTGLDAGQVLGQIRAAPQGSFLGLLTLDPPYYTQLRSRLAVVPGLITHEVTQRLFDSIAPGVVGSVQTENAPAFRQDGLAYQPGDTTGVSGLQETFQRRLVGVATTEVVVEDSRGHLAAVLRKWAEPAGASVTTTLNAAVQTAANRALGTTGRAAAIVAVQASTGKILAVAGQPGRGVTAPDPLDGQYPPGQAFTIVSTAALLDSGLDTDDPVPCTSVSDVGGETFTNDPPASGLGAQPTFGEDFARGCGTAFAGLSRRLSADELARTAAGFGLGSTWRLPLTAFDGTMAMPGNDADLAADTIGTGDVQVSPLDMALIAAQVDSGAWHSPTLVTDPAGPGDPPLASGYSMTTQVAGTLRGLMRKTVTDGAGRAANLLGSPVYGQAGQAALSQAGKNLQAMWFVGYRGGIAFAVLELVPAGHGPTGRDGSAAPLASQFLRRIPAAQIGS
jgi:cell division protein FtsI/penicillin-binding protein 2